MNHLPFLITTFIFFLLILLLLIYFIYRYLSLSRTPSNIPSTNPNQVPCSPDQTLQAWLTNIPNKSQCPPWTNNYVIGSDFKMYEKNFQVTTQPPCCFYSNDQNARTYFPNPWICLANTSGNFTLNQLNEKPYSYNGTAISYILPACNNNNCVGLIRYGLDTNGNGLYKIFRYSDQGSENNPDPNFQNITITVSPDCHQLQALSLNNSLIVARNAQGQLVNYDSNPQDRPTIIKDIIDLFNEHKFYPIAGANPVLSSELANISSN